MKHILFSVFAWLLLAPGIGNSAGSDWQWGQKLFSEESAVELTKQALPNNEYIAAIEQAVVAEPSADGFYDYTWKWAQSEWYETADGDASDLEMSKSKALEALCEAIPAFVQTHMTPDFDSAPNGTEVSDISSENGLDEIMAVGNELGPHLGAAAALYPTSVVAAAVIGAVQELDEAGTCRVSNFDILSERLNILGGITFAILSLEQGEPN